MVEILSLTINESWQVPVNKTQRKKNMKNKAWIKTGSLPAKKTSRKALADEIRQCRRKGWKMQKVVFTDAIGYQSDMGKDCPYANPYTYLIES